MTLYHRWYKFNVPQVDTIAQAGHGEGADAVRKEGGPLAQSVEQPAERGAHDEPHRREHLRSRVNCVPEHTRFSLQISVNRRRRNGTASQY